LPALYLIADSEDQGADISRSSRRTSIDRPSKKAYILAEHRAKGMSDGPVHSIPPSPAALPKSRVHWHVFLTHFPISMFGGAVGFQILHLFMAPSCFELATNVALIGGAVTLLPAIATGWSEWKNHFHGAKGLIFKRKITIAAGMAALSLPLVIWRTAFLGLFEEAPESPGHWIYLAGNAFLVLGAVLEGYFGGRLNHR
jgi:hypothetical protein